MRLAESCLRKNSVNQSNGSEEKGETCKQCHASFKDFHAIMSHICQPFKCGICNKRFSHDFQLKIHKCAVEDIDDKDANKSNRYLCDFCGVSFETLTILTQHSICCYKNKEKSCEDMPSKKRKDNNAVSSLDHDIGLSSVINGSLSDNSVSSNSVRTIHMSGQFRYSKKYSLSVATTCNNVNGDVFESEDPDPGDKVSNSGRNRSTKEDVSEFVKVSSSTATISTIANGTLLESEGLDPGSKVSNSRRRKSMKANSRDRNVCKLKKDISSTANIANGNMLESEVSDPVSKVSSSRKRKSIKVNSEAVKRSESVNVSSSTATISHIANGDGVESEGSDPGTKVSSSGKRKTVEVNSEGAKGSESLKVSSSTATISHINGDVVESEGSDPGSKVCSLRKRKAIEVDSEGIKGSDSLKVSSSTTTISHISGDVVESEGSDPGSKVSSSRKRKSIEINSEGAKGSDSLKVSSSTATISHIANDDVVESEGSDPDGEQPNSARTVSSSTATISNIANGDLHESEVSDLESKVSNSRRRSTNANSGERKTSEFVKVPSSTAVISRIANGDMLESEASDPDSEQFNSGRRKNTEVNFEGGKMSKFVKRSSSTAMISNIVNGSVLESEGSETSSDQSNSAKRKSTKTNSGDGKVSELLKVPSSSALIPKIANGNVLESESSSLSSEWPITRRRIRKKTNSEGKRVSKFVKAPHNTATISNIVNGDVLESEGSNLSSEQSYSARKSIRKKVSSEKGKMLKGIANGNALQSKDLDPSIEVSNSRKRRNTKVNSEEEKVLAGEIVSREISSVNGICKEDLIRPVTTKKVNNVAGKKTLRSVGNKEAISYIDKLLVNDLNKNGKKRSKSVIQKVLSEHDNGPAKRKTVNNVAGFDSKKRKIEEAKNKKTILQSSHNRQKSKVNNGSIKSSSLSTVSIQQKSKPTDHDVSDTESSLSSLSLRSRRSSSERSRRSNSTLSSAPLKRQRRGSSGNVAFPPARRGRSPIRTRTSVSTKVKNGTKTKKQQLSEMFVNRASSAPELNNVKRNSIEFEAPKSQKCQRKKISTSNDRIKEVGAVPNFCRELEVSESTLNAVPDDSDFKVFSTNSKQQVPGHQSKRKNSSNRDRNTVTLETMLNALPDENSGFLIKILSGTRKSFKCPKCCKHFQSIKAGITHLCKVSRIKKNLTVCLEDIEIFCTTCRYHCSRLPELTRHKQTCRHVSNSCQSLSDCLLDYENAPKNYFCATCNYSCLSYYTFMQHSCKEKLKYMKSAPKVVVERLDDKDIEASCNVCSFKCSACSNTFFDDDSFKRHGERHLNNGTKFSKVCIDKSKAVARDTIKNIIKKSKQFDSVDDIINNLVEPVSRVIDDMDPEKLLPDLELDATLPYETQKLLAEAARKILSEKTDSKKSTQTKVKIENEDLQLNVDPHTKQILDQLKNFECHCKNKVLEPSKEKKPCTQCLNNFMRTYVCPDPVPTSEMQDDERTSNSSGFSRALDKFVHQSSIEEIMGLSSIIEDSLSNIDLLSSRPSSSRNFAASPCDIGVPGPSGLQASNTAGPFMPGYFASVATPSCDIGIPGPSGLQTSNTAGPSMSGYFASVAAPSCDIGIPGNSGLQARNTAGPSTSNYFASVAAASSDIGVPGPSTFNFLAPSTFSGIVLESPQPDASSRTILGENSSQVIGDFDPAPEAGCSNSGLEQSNSTAGTVVAEIPDGFGDDGKVFYLSERSNSVRTESVNSELVPSVKVMCTQPDLDAHDKLYRKSVTDLAAQLQQIVISSLNSAELIHTSQPYLNFLSNLGQIVTTIINFDYNIDVEFQLASVNVTITFDFNSCFTCSAFIRANKCVCAFCSSELPPSSLVEHLVNEHKETKIVVVFVS